MKSKENRRTYWSGLLSVMALCMPFHATATSGSPWIFSAELALTTNDNIGQAQRTRDIIQDHSTLVNLDAVYVNQLDLQHVLTFRGYFETEQFNKLDDISRQSLGGQATFRWQNELGFQAPFYLFNVGLQFDDYNVEQRNSSILKSQLVASRRFSDRITLSTGLDYQQRQSNGNVFDTQKTRIFASMDYDLPGSWTYYGAYSFIRGDTISTAQVNYCNGLPASDIYGLISWAEEIEPDNAFNAGFCGNWFSYRLKADTHTLNIGLNKGLSQDMSLDISALAVTVNADGANTYDSLLLRIGLLMRF